ncbi:MAG: GHKL domain-containing protein [Candidatus Thiodiazotropha sp. (ex Dulcina madagascariensis)]|nr:GHKL domain-containing protein [Candidatus Thiodiazotropha sp. (ex Dulcina madagascariensis)]
MVLNRVDLENTLLSLGDYVMLLDMSCRKVIWQTDKFKKRFTALDVGSPIEKVFSYFHGLSNAIRKIDITSVYTRPELFAIRGNNNARYKVAITSIGNSKIALRIHKDFAEEDSRMPPLHDRRRPLRDRRRSVLTSKRSAVCEMATTLAHEINQPIGTISNLLHGVRMRLDSCRGIEPSVFNAIDKSIEQTKYTSDIVTRISEFSQSRKPKYAKIRVASLIKKCVSLLEWEIRKNQVEVRLDFYQETVEIHADELMLRQVIVNLIKNAVEAMRGVPDFARMIEIVIQQKNTDIEIAIKDQGVGISDDEAETLFVPFVSNKSTGMGVGLNICRLFIELHNGKLWLTSNKGHGCISHILLPIKQQGW